MNSLSLNPIIQNVANNNLAILDTGCSCQCLGNDAYFDNKLSTTHGITIGIPNGQSIKASHTADLDLNDLPIDLPPSAKHASVFKKLQHAALISIAQFCDVG